MRVDCGYLSLEKSWVCRSMPRRTVDHDQFISGVTETRSNFGGGSKKVSNLFLGMSYNLRIPQTDCYLSGQQWLRTGTLKTPSLGSVLRINETLYLSLLILGAKRLLRMARFKCTMQRADGILPLSVTPSLWLLRRCTSSTLRTFMRYSRFTHHATTIRNSLESWLPPSNTS